MSYLDIARQVAVPDEYETNEKSATSLAKQPDTWIGEYERNETNEIRSDLLFGGPPPSESDILDDCRRWLADGTVERFSREKGSQVRTPGNPPGIRISHGIWVNNGPEFIRRCLKLIDEGREGPRTWQRLEIYYWELYFWVEETKAVKF